MYAIVEVGGMQCKVSKQDVIRVPRLQEEPGKSVDVRVLMVVDQDQVHIGKPWVPNVKVKAVVLVHGKAKKVLVFKKKRRKNYKVLKGHRQDFTELRIDQISFGSEKEKRETIVKEDVKSGSKSIEKPKSVKKTETKVTKTKRIATETQSKVESTSKGKKTASPAEKAIKKTTNGSGPSKPKTVKTDKKRSPTEKENSKASKK